MPEGHTLHRLAADCADVLGGGVPLQATSPQGRFTDGARVITGAPLDRAEAHGKHLFLGFGAGRWVHIHLGLYGKASFGAGEPPEPVGQVRLRLVRADPRPAWLDLRGPAACALITGAEKAALHRRLGPDPLRPPADPYGNPAPARARLARSRLPVAALLMDQKILAGVGNVYRAEVLFRQRIDPLLPGRDLTDGQFAAIWDDLAVLMAAGVENNRIDTVRPEHTPEAMGRPPRVDDHGGEVYVYRRTGLPCLVCGTPVSTAELAARNLFWCGTCQPPAGAT